MLKHSEDNRGVTFRAVLIALFFLPVNVYLVVQWETVWGTQYPTTMAIFFNAIFSLLLVVMLNVPLRRLLPNLALRQKELLTIYIILIMAITVSGHDFSQTIFSTLITAHWFATPENDWSSIFWNYVPPKLTINDDKVIREFIEGESSFYRTEYVAAWMQPLILWSIYLTVLVFTMLCITVFIRKQWIDREKLSYPLVHLPFEMTVETEGGLFFGNQLFWIGALVAGGICLLNGLGYIFPFVPSLTLSYKLSAHFTSPPLNAITRMTMYWNPYAIGLAFLIPLDLLFSCWFLFIVWQIQRVVGAMMGINVSGYPLPDQQILGGYLGISIVAIWLARKPITSAVRHAWQIKQEADDRNEPMRYRTALMGMIGGTIFLVGFFAWAGMSASFAFSFFAVYFMIMFAFTRMRAELGPPLQGIHYSGPLQLMVAMVGSRRLTRQTLTVAAPLWTATKELRNNPMPFTLESFKLADRSGINTRHLWKMMVLAAFLGSVITFWAFLQMNYRWGGVGAWRGVSAYTVIERWITHPIEADIMFLVATGFGFIFVLINTIMRLRFLWWPIHPLGYPLAGYYHFDKLWLPFFLGWLIKLMILRHGGIRAYRKVFPFFLGLVLGAFSIGSVWGIIGLVSGKPTYAFKDW